MGNIIRHSPSDILLQLLIDEGLGTDPSLDAAWPTYGEDLPDSPDNVLCTYETGGRRDGRTMPDGEVQSHFGLKVRVRSTTHPVGYLKARTIALALDALWNVTTVLDGVTYRVQCLNRQGEVLPLGFDFGSHRRLFDVNYQAVIITF